MLPPVAIFLLAFAGAALCGLLVLAAVTGARRAQFGHRFENSIRNTGRPKSFTVR